MHTFKQSEISSFHAFIHAYIQTIRNSKFSCILTCIHSSNPTIQSLHAFIHAFLMLIKLAKVVFSKDRRPSRYKVWSVDTVILSIQDSVLMIIGLTWWYEVNLRSAMMIRDPLDTRSGLTFSFSALVIRDPLDTRSGLTFSFSALVIRDPPDTRSGLTFSFSALAIRDPLDTRSGLTFSFSAVVIRNSLNTRSGFTLYFSTVMIRSPLVLKRSRLWRHFFCFLLSFKLRKIFSSRTKSVISIFTYLLL